MGRRTRYTPGTFCWAGLATSNPAAAVAFYPHLSGWEAEPLLTGEAGTYTILRRAGHDVAICYRQTAQARAAGAPPHGTSYLSVEDADAITARAGELGGAAVFREPFDVPGAGRASAPRWSMMSAPCAGMSWPRPAPGGLRRFSASCSAGSIRPRAAAPPRSPTPGAATGASAPRPGRNRACHRPGSRISRLATPRTPRATPGTPSGVQTPRSVHYEQARKECQ